MIKFRYHHEHSLHVLNNYLGVPSKLIINISSLRGYPTSRKIKIERQSPRGVSILSTFIMLIKRSLFILIKHIMKLIIDIE